MCALCRWEVLNHGSGLDSKKQFPLRNILENHRRGQKSSKRRFIDQKKYKKCQVISKGKGIQFFTSHVTLSLCFLGLTTLTSLTREMSSPKQENLFPVTDFFFVPKLFFFAPTEFFACRSKRFFWIAKTGTFLLNINLSTIKRTHPHQATLQPKLQTWQSPGG